MTDDLIRVYRAIKSQAKNAIELNKYYLGDQPLMYSHERLRQVFDRSGVNFVQNWCAVVVDTTCDRLVLKGWDNPTDAINNEVDNFWEQEHIQSVSRKIHRDAVVTGNGFIVLDYVGGELRAFYNSPTQVAVLYEEDDPLIKRVGGKMYYDSVANSTNLNLYYPDRIEKYTSTDTDPAEGSFRLLEIIPNIFGRVPIIHFRTQSDLPNVIPLQDAINKTFSDMMVVAEFNAFPQRWMITNADITSLTASPAAIMKIPKGAQDEEGTSVGEFGAANLGMYLDTIDKLTNTIAVISRTPRHYFMHTGANISGEALTVMETPLIKKITQLQESFDENWLELASYINPDPKTVCIWTRPETEQMTTQSQAMAQMVNMGIPLVTVLRRFGWANDEIIQMEKDLAEQKTRNADLAAAAFELATIRMEQSDNPYLPEANTQTKAERADAE